MGSGQLRNLNYIASICSEAIIQPLLHGISHIYLQSINLQCYSASQSDHSDSVTTSILQYSLQTSDKVSVTYDIVYTSIQYI